MDAKVDSTTKLQSVQTAVMTKSRPMTPGIYYDPTNAFMYCALYNNKGKVLASLGMVEAINERAERDNYRRVVEAELALEAMPKRRIAA